MILIVRISAMLCKFKVIPGDPVENMNICTNICANPSSRCWGIIFTVLDSSFRTVIFNTFHLHLQHVNLNVSLAAYHSQWDSLSGNHEPKMYRGKFKFLRFFSWDQNCGLVSHLQSCNAMQHCFNIFQHISLLRWTWTLQKQLHWFIPGES